MADISLGPAARTVAVPVVDGQRNASAWALTWALASIVMVLVLLLPALWNGFPLIFPDTGGYLTRPIEGALLMGRSAFYGLFLYAGMPFAFWLNVLVQAAVTVWLIVLTLRSHGLVGRPWLALAIVAGLTVGTSLPWLAGELLPDIWFPVAVLALHLLAFHAGRLALAERLGLAAVMAFAIASHMAAAGLFAAMIAALWLVTRIAALALPRPRLMFAAAAVAAGIMLCPLSNYVIAGKFAFTPGGTSFLFGRLVEDGIIARYLDERCPDPALRLCAYKAELPSEADDWLWDNGSAFYKLGGHVGFRDEARAIILDTIERYPFTHAAAAIADTFSQFFSFKTEVSIEDNGPALQTLADRTPQLTPALMAARQQNGTIDAGLLNLVHEPLAALTLLGVIAALLFHRRLNVAPELAALCLTIILALAINAAICGVFSHPVDRYQSRLMPLAPFAIALLMASRRRADRLGARADLP